MRMEIDGREVNQLSFDLRRAPVRVKRAAGQVLRKGSIETAKAMREDARGARRRPYRSRIRHLSKSASWERVGELEYEIGLGPKPDTQGSLAHIFAHGSINNASLYDWTAGPERVEPHIVEMFADAGEDSVFGKGQS